MSWRWLLWLLPIYVVALIVFAPARLVLWFIPDAAPVELSAVQGSLWQGQSDLSYQNNGQTLNFYEVSWQLAPWQLLSGQVMLDVQLPARNVTAGSAQLQLGFDGAVQLNAELGGTIQQAISSYQLPVPVTVDGRWSLQLTDYQLADLSSSQWCNQLQGTLTTRGTALRLNQQWTELGPFQTELSCSAKNEIVATMKNDNTVGLSFTSVLAGNRQVPKLEVQGRVEPTAKTPRAIADMLVFMGKPDSSGAYPFRFKL
ncbi:hypothetical protein PSI9734_01573 [Pseudidiomarina piscicola]|uniref:Type II secretion system protein N n=1 Tax=Pseudidiomarina piscicola TaxID=2614830 RepID=A0A6S6WPJ1_9GAMM|nr:type II secretion system protein N [Pseudidiomarina piscicola]CAB0151160.1 hypothetical protein PSI9734_01573 [Pseudidiomarina piscicola]VZT40666.1 hypothetical protein PSI9734_01573 [Pseudomonas aeruginosa]